MYGGAAVGVERYENEHCSDTALFWLSEAGCFSWQKSEVITQSFGPGQLYVILCNS